MRILLMLLPILLGFRSLPESYRGITKEELKNQLDRTIPKQSKPIERVIKKKSISKKVPFNPAFGKRDVSIATFERFKGVVDGNIISSGTPVNFKVDFLDSRKVPRGSYLSCTGTNLVAKFNYRILALCDRLITPSYEFEVVVGIKDLKKVDGIEPDHVYVGDEESILGEGFSAIMSGIIDARKKREKTTIGYAEVPSVKNSYLNGILNAASLANQKAKEHTSKQVIVLAVKDRTKVIIEFKRRFEYENKI